MSSVTNPQSESPDHDELVAYLDGELAPADSRAVEERLANDAEYRQQLRDLDQAWEALNVLPTTAVDDGFAKTTIELACVAAEEDLSQRTQLAAVENRSRKRWWIAGGVAAAVIGFIMMRALAVHRNNLLLADLPVIGQINALTNVSDVDFLRQLSSAVPPDEFVNDKSAYERTLHDFTSANAPTLGERRQWVDSLTAEQKADLADRTRAFETLRQNPAEKDRVRKLTNDISHAEDAAQLQATLVAYGQWLSARHTAGEQEQMRKDFEGLSPGQRVDAIRKAVERENEQAAWPLSPEDVGALRREIFELAKEKKAELLKKWPEGPARKGVEAMNVGNVGPALFILRESLQPNEYGEATINRLLSKLSPAANEHWNKLPRRPRDKQRAQLYEWIHQAIQTKWGPEHLESFFTNNLTYDERQRLLNMPKADMKAELERLYLKSDLKIDDRWQLLREFGGVGRGPRNGQGPWPPEGGPPGEGGRRRPDGPPPGERFGPDGPPPGERFDRDRPPRPGDQRGVRPEDRPDGGRPDGRPRRRPNDPANEPPPGPQSPPLDKQPN